MFLYHPRERESGGGKIAILACPVGLPGRGAQNLYGTIAEDMVKGYGVKELQQEVAR